ncbi:MAG: hypothetical protein HYS32_03275 [Candidatus Woesearchaeota archaeon]|nr:MAG: hypothetical protein HYS32_03275 [Candidatus Woesearchaeota archaeon]
MNKKAIFKISQTTFLLLIAVVSIIGTIFVLTNEGITGAVTGTTNITVYGTTTITLSTSVVDLGNLTLGGTNATVNASATADGFVIRNDGNVRVNISVSATNLFSSSSNPTPNYTFFVSYNSTEGICFTSSGTTQGQTNMPSATTVIINRLNSTDSCDTAEVDINITIPLGESTGAKASTVTFLAIDAS